MRLTRFFSIVVSMLLCQQLHAASVVEFGGHRANTLQDKVVGKWQLVAIYEGSENISAQETLRDYWIFKDNGWVEHYEEPFGLRRSTYWMEGRKLTVKTRDNQSIREFLVKYVDREKLILKIRLEGRTYTYNMARY